MAASKRKTPIKQGGNPSGGIQTGGNPTRGIRTGGNPDSIMSYHPSWKFISCDSDGTWAFCQERLTDVFWTKIFPKIQEWESMTWNQITIVGKKQNHSIEVNSLNKCAQDKLAQLQIEEESLLSLRLEGSVRLYGFLVGPVYNILWYDDNHGDNETCVCRSTLKHT